MIKNIFEYVFDAVLNLVFGVIMLAFLCGIIASPWVIYYYNIWKSPCTEVYDGYTLIYKGKSCFYTTESRGTGTIFKQYEEKIFFAKQLKEIQSNKISIKTILCEQKDVK